MLDLSPAGPTLQFAVMQKVPVPLCWFLFYNREFVIANLCFIVLTDESHLILVMK